MFVSHRTLLPVSFDTAQARLENLTHGGWLSGASADAYADGLAGTIRVGPFGDVPGVSKLVKVGLLEPVARDQAIVLALRWEATGLTGKLFPVLDADLTLTPADGEQTLMRLDGAYRPPLGSAGASLDRVMLGRVANATIRSLLTRIADAIAHPAPVAELGTESTAGTTIWLVVDPESPAL